VRQRRNTTTRGRKFEQIPILESGPTGGRAIAPAHRLSCAPSEAAALHLLALHLLAQWVATGFLLGFYRVSIGFLLGFFGVFFGFFFGFFAVLFGFLLGFFFGGFFWVIFGLFWVSGFGFRVSSNFARPVDTPKRKKKRRAPKYVPPKKLRASESFRRRIFSEKMGQQHPDALELPPRTFRLWS